jgi:hypothetical protein
MTTLRFGRFSLVLVAVLGLALPAAAWPVDWIHEVAVGREKFVKLPSLDWFEVQDPKVAQVEWFAENGELLLTGLKAGHTQVLLGSNGRVAVWRVRVGEPPLLDEQALPLAKKACPGLTLTPLEDVKLTVTLETDACFTALTRLFETDAFEARHLELTFAGAVLQTQLKGLQAKLSKKVKARYVGAGLVLEGGPLTPPEHREALWAVFRTALGRLALDDQLDVLPEPPAVDAGTPPKK